MASRRVLIVGAGISGSVLAYWLGKHGFQVLVVERSRSEQTAGQGLEIEEPALTVVREMGVLEELQARRTGEKGFELVNQYGQSYGVLEAGGVSPTGALEMMRGDMTDVFYRAADRFKNVEYRFETVIISLSQTADKVTVELEERTSKRITKEEFDFVVGADGARSRTRQLALGSPRQLDCFKRVGAYCAYFSIPSALHDWPNSRCCQFAGRRIIWLRPLGEKAATTSVYMIYLHDQVPNLSDAIANGDRTRQKEELANIFSNLGWESDRVLQEMKDASNFYCDELSQVKLPKWSQGRVVLVGDAAWSPTPFTGEGNQLAIEGAWVLAQELCSDRSTAAFQAYESRFRAYVEQAQQIPLYGYAPYVFAPSSIVGIWLFRTLYAFVAHILLPILSRFSSQKVEEADKHAPFDMQVERWKLLQPKDM